jgi:hypothetical protein
MTIPLPDIENVEPDAFLARCPKCAAVVFVRRNGHGWQLPDNACVHAVDVIAPPAVTLPQVVFADDYDDGEL